MKKIKQRVKQKIRKLFKGFTLIELLVVLSIISILANVAFSTYADARNNAHDANVKLVLSSLRSSAFNEAFNYDPYSFAAVCQDTPIDLALKDLSSSENISTTDYQCTASTNEWAVVFPLKKQAQYWCADANGFSNIVSGFLSKNTPGSLNCSNATYIPVVPESTPPPPVPVNPPQPPASVPNTAPSITLVGANPFHFWSPSFNPFSGVGTGANKYVEPGYTAFDTEDGVISSSVFITGPTLISQAGPTSCKTYTYKITYGVVDSQGLSAPYVTRDIVHHKCTTNHPNSGYHHGDDDNDHEDDD